MIDVKVDNKSDNKSEQPLLLLNKEEGISKKEAISINRDIKRLVKSKSEVDRSLCKLMFFSKNCYVASNTSPVPFYRYCGFSSWDEYIEKHIGISTKLANKYSNVYHKYFIDLKDVFDADKHFIDIDKLNLIIPIVNRANFNDLINKVKKASKKDLKALLSPIKCSHRTFGYRVNAKEAKIVSRAMKIARKNFGSNLTDPQLFVCIMSKYASEASN